MPDEPTTTSGDGEVKASTQRNPPLLPWIQVGTGFVLMFNSWGLINAFGVFQEYYTALDPAIASQSSTSWIGSLQTAILLICGSATGSFVDKGHARIMALTGSVLITLGLIFASFSGEFTTSHRPVFYQILLSHGVLSGLGMGLLLVPSTAIVPTYFTENRAFAVGLANSGASIGGIIYPILTRRLLSKIGFSWSMRAIALVVVVTAGAGALLVRQRSELTRNPTKRTLYQFQCMKEPTYAFFAGGVWLAFAASYIPYYYVSVWVRDTAFPLHGIPSYYLLSILNAGGLVGRIIPSFVADKFVSGPVLTQALAAIICGALALGWTYIRTSLGGLVVWLLAYGFFSGSYISLIPASAATLTSDMSKLGGRLGVVFAGNAFASLIGSPVAGAIMRDAPSGWQGVGGYCAALNLAGGCLLMVSWVLNVRLLRLRSGDTIR